MSKIFKNFVDITRIKRPIGIFLLLLPCLIGIFYANSSNLVINSQNINLTILFAIGAAAMRSAGCIINDIFDRNFDQKVARTKNRPLANGQMSLNQAYSFTATLLIIGLLVLIQFNIYAIICGFISLFLVILYPLMKRITYFPQLFLGVVFNIGFLVAILQIKQTLTIDDFLIYLALIIFTFIYDTIYGFQDIEDDLKIGVKSSSIALSKNPKNIFIALLLIAFSLILNDALDSNYGALFYLVIFFTLAYSLFLIKKWQIKNQESCLKIFKRFLVILFLVMIAYIFKS